MSIARWAALSLVVFTAACAPGPQYVSWRRIGSSPVELTQDGPLAQRQLKSDFAECAIYVKSVTGYPPVQNFPNDDDKKRVQTARSVNNWDVMETCMRSKGWTYVSAGYRSAPRRAAQPAAAPVNATPPAQQMAAPTPPQYSAPMASPVAPVAQEPIGGAQSGYGQPGYSYSPQQAPAYGQPSYAPQYQPQQQAGGGYNEQGFSYHAPPQQPYYAPAQPAPPQTYNEPGFSYSGPGGSPPGYAAPIQIR